MKTIYRADDGKEFENHASCVVYETELKAKQEKDAADLTRRRSEDFDFLVFCSAKGNMAMYHLLRDKTLDK